MNKVIHMFFSTLFLLCMIFSPTVCDAHALWINFTDYAPEYNNQVGKTKLYIGWGHHFPLDGYVKESDFIETKFLSPEGKVTLLKLTGEGFLSSPLNLKEEGGYLFAITRKTAYNTSYSENGTIKHIKGTKEGKDHIISSVFSQQFAKSIINIGNKPSKNSFDTEIGHKLEIIPITNPYTITQSNSIMKVKVLFDGKPLPFVKVFGAYEGFDSGDMACCAASTDRFGIASLRLIHWGNWILKTKVEMPATKEFSSKVNEEKYYASLTFHTEY